SLGTRRAGARPQWRASPAAPARRQPEAHHGPRQSPAGRTVSGVALLDVNVLVALFDPDHVHHEPAHRWFAEQRGTGWATCPLTENGLLRVLTHPAYT